MKFSALLAFIGTAASYTKEMEYGCIGKLNISEGAVTNAAFYEKDAAGNLGYLARDTIAWFKDYHRGVYTYSIVDGREYITRNDTLFHSYNYEQ